MKYLIGALTSAFVIGGLFLFSERNAPITVSAPAISPSTPVSETSKTNNGLIDIERQKLLTNPPSDIKAVYLTGWSAGNAKRVDYIIDLIKKTELNAVVIDIKDYSGYVSYDILAPEIEKYKAKEIKIPRLNALIKKLHDENIYVIARITIFQDPVLAEARPDLAIHSKDKLINNRQLITDNRYQSSSTLWLDHKKLAWIDPSAKEAWDYNLIIAKDAVKRGFDELNFDYVRFASDGNLNDMEFPFWNEKTLKAKIINDFSKYLRESLPGIKISVDLFGSTTAQNDDMGIGQLIENAYDYFDYVSPMIYPSHYSNGFLNYKNPAEHPYEIVKYSMENALWRLTNHGLQTTATSTEIKAKLRPWLQDFDLGADYNAEMVKKQIQAVYDTASSAPKTLNGWMLWNPSNIYTKEALKYEL